jgi:hypothetical protein
MFYPELSRCYSLDLHLVILSFLTIVSDEPNLCVDLGFGVEIE